jgi:hypothetical protein
MVYVPISNVRGEYIAMPNERQLQATAIGAEATLEGKTWKIRDELKFCGFQWREDIKRWRGESARLYELRDKLQLAGYSLEIDGDEPQPTTETIETPAVTPEPDQTPTIKRNSPDPWAASLEDLARYRTGASYRNGLRDATIYDHTTMLQHRLLELGARKTVKPDIYHIENTKVDTLGLVLDRTEGVILVKQPDYNIATPPPVVQDEDNGDAVKYLRDEITDVTVCIITLPGRLQSEFQAFAKGFLKRARRVA